MTDQNFSDLVLSQVEPDQKTEWPQVVYDQDGDCIEFLAVDEDFKAERVNSILTVYVGRESGEIVGSLIKGVHAIIKTILDKYPGFRLEVRGGRIRLEHIFSAAIWTSSEEEGSQAMDVYLKLREASKRSNAEAVLQTTSKD